jgi:hypothetical protein
MALRKVLTLGRSPPGPRCLEGRRVLIQPSFRSDDRVQSHFRKMIRPSAGHPRKAASRIL